MSHLKLVNYQLVPGGKTRSEGNDYQQLFDILINDDV